MKTKLFILRNLSDQYALFVMKEFDPQEQLWEKLQTANQSGWWVEQEFLVDTDIYERLPQYSLINMEEQSE